MKPPAFQFYVDDYLGGTQHFSDAEKGLYMALLCEQWSKGSLPDDDEELASFSRNETPIHRVKRKFEKGKDGRLRNARMEIEREKQRIYRLSRSINGKLGGRKPYGKHMVSTAKAQLKHKQSSPSPSPSPSPVSDPLTKEGGVPASPVPSNHADFIDGWSKEFKAFFGADYTFDGGRDGKAVRDLLRATLLTGPELLAVVKKAWVRGSQAPKSFPCLKASSIHGFKDYLNDIQVELKNGTLNQTYNKRLEGVTPGVTDYGAAAKRKMERQASEAANRPPPQTQGNGG